MAVSRDDVIHKVGTRKLANKVDQQDEERRYIYTHSHFRIYFKCVNLCIWHFSFMVFNTQHQGPLLETARKGRMQRRLTIKKERRDDYSQRRRSNVSVSVAFSPPPLHFQPPPLPAPPLSISLPLCICQLTAALPSLPSLHLPVRVLQPLFLQPSSLPSLVSLNFCALSSIKPRHLFLRWTHSPPTWLSFFLLSDRFLLKCLSLSPAVAALMMKTAGLLLTTPLSPVLLGGSKLQQQTSARK